MKKNLYVAVAAIGLAVITVSCGKTCTCIHYEDGKKIFLTESENKYFEKSLCEANSVKPYKANSIVVKNKEVTKEVKCK